jgi:repressor of nif and glnA expression
MPKQLTESDAERLIIDLLTKAGEPLTTREIEKSVQGQGKQCPDSAVRFLTKMRYKGMIKGELSMEHKGWIWWIENER